MPLWGFTRGFKKTRSSEDNEDNEAVVILIKQRYSWKEEKTWEEEAKAFELKP